MAKLLGVLDLAWKIRDTNLNVYGADDKPRTAKINGKTLPLSLDADSTLLLVMLTLRSNHKKGFSCTVSLSRLAQDCRCSKATISRRLILLEEMGLVSHVQRYNTSSVYAVKAKYIHALAQQQKSTRESRSEMEARLIEENTVVLDDDTPATTTATATTTKASGDSEMREALVESIGSLNTSGAGFSISEKDKLSMARTLMKRIQDHTLAICSLAHLTPDLLQKAANADRGPVPFLIGSLEKIAHRLDGIEYEINEWDRNLVSGVLEEVLKSGTIDQVFSSDNSPAEIRQFMNLIRQESDGDVVIGDLVYNPYFENGCLPLLFTARLRENISDQEMDSFAQRTARLRASISPEKFPDPPPDSDSGDEDRDDEDLDDRDWNDEDLDDEFPYH